MPARSNASQALSKSSRCWNSHRQRLAWREAEERGVELVGVVQESALTDVAGAGAVGVFVVEGVGVPAAVRREVGDGVHAVGDQAPEVFG
ncbi:hypothetical protein SALBM311S_10845 [Streptomyces alboniger]